MIWLVLGIVIFLGIHCIRMVAPNWRDRFIAERGEGTWKGLYSLISILSFVLLIWGYGQARLDNVSFWSAPSWMSHITALLMLFALIILMAFNFPPGHIKARLKHPMLVAIKIWAFSHLLVNGDLASMLLFGSFLAYAVWNRISLKRRPQGTMPAPQAKYDVAAIIIGVALYLWLVLHGHAFLFGVAPFA